MRKKCRARFKPVVLEVALRLPVSGVTCLISCSAAHIRLTCARGFTCRLHGAEWADPREALQVKYQLNSPYCIETAVCDSRSACPK